MKFLLGLILGSIVSLVASIYAVDRTTATGVLNTGFDVYQCRVVDVKALKLGEWKQ
jgi:hypothetical protein